ncbi:hypothetical protein JCGZ_15529 [Jatropha curcas]|uniref:Uncharacterized protein n=1 Tax=Jatropha curcas TaxID=180498 RepID=A0A067K6W6_JATCU|nr:hypothetical protein JCGZ_15529 [Jatropha curcas]
MYGGRLARTRGGCHMMSHTTCCLPGRSSWSRTLLQHARAWRPLIIWLLLSLRQQHRKLVMRGSDYEALDKAVVVSKSEHARGASFSSVFERTGRTAQHIMGTHKVSPYWMTPPGCTHAYSEVEADFEFADLLAVRYLLDLAYRCTYPAF